MHAGRIQRNADSSPLLRLPLEIRRQIFVEVLGDRLIHFKKIDDDWMTDSESDDSSSSASVKESDRWHIFVCAPTAAEPIEGGHSEQEQQKDEDEAAASEASSEWTDTSDTEDGDDQEEDSDEFTDDQSGSSDMDGSTDFFDRCSAKKRQRAEQLQQQAQDQKVQRLIGNWSEENCRWQNLHNSIHDRPFSGLANDLGQYRCNRELQLYLLRTCRQIYTEVNQVMWGTNIFSFNDVHSFRCFMKARNNYQKRLIKKLRLAMNFGPRSTHDWNSALSMSLVTSLQGLRLIWLAINYRKSATEFEKSEQQLGPTRSANLQMTYLEGIRRLATLPLSQVKVSVTAIYLGDLGPLDCTMPGERQWTQQQREKYADRIRTRLLDVDGVKLLQQENEIVKAFRLKGKKAEAARKARTQPFPRDISD